MPCTEPPLPANAHPSSPSSATCADIMECSATELSRAIRTRAVSCTEVLDAYLGQIQRINPKVNALVSLLPEDALRASAAALDDELGKGRWRGPLHGFPQAPKDLLPAAGLLTTKGSPLFEAEISGTDAVATARLRASGALFVGRSNSPEFGLGGHTYNTVFGTTGNAFAPSLCAGGSSGGAAVAVALRMLPVADGTDMMGSLRTPAAFNNVFGLRPSLGRVPHGPGNDVFFQQLSVTGPMARSIPDLALMLSVQAGFDSRLPLSLPTRSEDIAPALERDFKGVRVGWLGDLGGQITVARDVQDCCRSALASFEAIGCEVEDVPVSFDMEMLWRAWIDLRSFYLAGGSASLYKDKAKRALLKPEACWEIERGLQLDAHRVFQATCERSQWYDYVQRLFERYEYLALPATQLHPFDGLVHWPARIDDVEVDTYHRWIGIALPASMAGIPALSVPSGFTAQGLPFGIQVLAPAQQDRAVLELGHALDQAMRHSLRRSPLLPSTFVPPSF